MALWLLPFITTTFVVLYSCTLGGFSTSIPFFGISFMSIMRMWHFESDQGDFLRCCWRCWAFLPVDVQSWLWFLCHREAPALHLDKKVTMEDIGRLKWVVTCWNYEPTPLQLQFRQCVGSRDIAGGEQRYSIFPQSFWWFAICHSSAHPFWIILGDSGLALGSKSKDSKCVYVYFLF